MSAVRPEVLRRNRGAVARSDDCWALVLAGGDGTRLQELTRRITGKPIPKQYCPLLDGRSMLESTLLRARHFVPPERTLAVVNRDHLAVAGAQLRQLPTQNVVVQPRNCDTGPGIVFALLQLARRRPDARVVLLPSDHYVDDDRAFMAHVDGAARLVQRSPDTVTMLGIAPDRPDPGYGYIEPAEPVPVDGAPPRTFRVRAFHEKPDPALAGALCETGALWNCFVTVTRVDRLLAQVRRVATRRFDSLAPLRDRPEEAANVYRRLRPWNFSRGFLARIPERLAVVRVEGVHWSDWGTQASIERSLRRLNRTLPWPAAVPAVAGPAGRAVA